MIYKISVLSCKKIVFSLILFLVTLFWSFNFTFAEENDNNSKYKLKNTNYFWNVKVINGDLYHLESEYLTLRNHKQKLYKNFQEQKTIDNIENIYFYKNIIFYKIKENNKFYFKINDKILGNKFDNLTDISFDDKWNIYAIWKINLIWDFKEKFFLVKNWKKISNWFNDISNFSIKNINEGNNFTWVDNKKYSKYFILNNNYYLLVNEWGKEVFYKNNKKIFEANNIDDISYNNIIKKFYFKFNFNLLRWLANEDWIIISNFLDNKLPEYFNLKFSNDWKTLILINSDKKIYKIIWKISEEEKKEFLSKKEKSSVITLWWIKNKIDFTKKIKYWFYWDYEKNFYSTDKKFILLKKLWSDFSKKNKEKLDIKKLDLLANKIANKMKTINNIEKKEIYLYLLLNIKDSLDKIENDKLFESYDEEIKNYKNKNIWFEYEPRYYKPYAKPINITKINKTYDKENNRFILEVESTIADIEEASDYYWWSSSNWYFKKYDDEKYIEENWEFKKVYFYPASSKPTNDYKIIVNWGDNIWYVDSNIIAIKAEEFSYKKFDSSKIETNLEIVEKDKYMFWGVWYNAYTFYLKGEEEYNNKKSAPENINIYLKSISWEKLEESKLIYTKKIDEFKFWEKNKFWFSPFSLLSPFWDIYNNDKSEYFWKELEFELEVTFPNSVKNIKFKTVYLPAYTIFWEVYSQRTLKDFRKKIIIWESEIYLKNYDNSYDNDFRIEIKKEKIIEKYEEYINSWKKDNFEMELKYWDYLDYYWFVNKWSIKMNSERLNIYITNFYLEDLDKEKIKEIKNKYARKYFEYLVEDNYTIDSEWKYIEKSFKKTLDEMKKELDWKEKNNIEMQDLYLRIKNNLWYNLEK